MVAIYWSKEESSKIVRENPESAWENLVNVLGLPQEINLPFWFFDKLLSPNHLHKGMKWKIKGGIDGQIRREAALSSWQPQQKRLEITLYTTDGENRESVRQYDLSVHPSSEAGKSEIQLIISNSENFYRVKRQLVNWIEHRVGISPYDENFNEAEQGLQKLINLFPSYVKGV